MIGSIQGAGSMPNSEMMAQMKERMFQRLDHDGTGQIELDQLQAQAEQIGKADSAHFSQMLEALKAADTDGDGMVSQTEFESMKPPPPPPTGGMGGRRLEMMQAMQTYSSSGLINTEADMTQSLLDLLG